MIEIGEIVKVKGKQGSFTVLDIIKDDGGAILGYGMRDKRLMTRWYRVDTVSPKKKKKAKRKSRK